jgi:Ras-related C3 botulinum toxin substrate 1
LIGSKPDLRDNPLDGMTPIPKSKGEEMMKKIVGCDYVECSSYKALKLSEAFEAAIKVALNPPAKEQSESKAASASGDCFEIIRIKMTILFFFENKFFGDLL